MFVTPDNASRDNADYFSTKENVGKLLLIEVHEYVESVTTVNGDKDAVRVDVTVLGAEIKEYKDTLLFSGPLIGLLKRYAGKGQKVLGTLGQGEAKKGWNAPYKLIEPTPAQVQAATEYVNSLKAADPFAV